MKITHSLILVVMLTGLFVMPAVFAEDSPKDIAAKCKAEATENEVPANEMRKYIADCLTEYGIEAADAEAILNDVAPAAEQGSDDRG